MENTFGTFFAARLYDSCHQNYHLLGNGTPFLRLRNMPGIGI